MSIQDNIKNCLICKKGNHILYRDFGLKAVDDVGGIKKSDIKLQLSKFYPDIQRYNISMNNSDSISKGEFIYNINIYGTEDL